MGAHTYTNTKAHAHTHLPGCWGCSNIWWQTRGCVSWSPTHPDPVNNNKQTKIYKEVW